jgi:hypothetical protein
MKPAIQKALLGGAAGTAIITMMMYLVAPMMLGRSMDIAAMLGSMMGNSWSLGMIAHVMIGVVVFPLAYAFVIYRLLPGGPTVRGVVWGIALWLIAQAMVMPMMGAGFFSAAAGGMMAAVASLMGHILYGGTLGAIAGPAQAAETA